jgi:hypothetical protein
MSKGDGEEMSFLRDGFDVPEGFETTRFRLRHITIHDVVKDYDAVMTNRDQLWSQFGECWGWPREDLSLEQDLIDLAWHQKEGQLKRSFNFAILTLDEKRLLGCFYIDPPGKEGYDAELYLWVRRDGVPADMEVEVLGEVKKWTRENWPFQKPAWPVREISWEEWDR